MFKYLTVLMLVATVSGCAGLFPSAAEPQSGDRAQLRGAGGGFQVDQNICGDRPDLAAGFFIDLGTPYYHRSIGMPTTGTLQGAWGEMYVRADKPIKIIATYVSGTGARRAETYVKLEKNHSYQANITSSMKLVIADITGGANNFINLSDKKLPCN